MVIVGNKLKKLITKFNVAPKDSYDDSCVKLTLSNEIVKLKCNKINTITYGQKLPNEVIEYITINEKNLVLQPHESLLACSNEEVNMPLGYAGFLQTKGSLARLLVSIHFSDGQIDPGFKGRVTFEICNASCFNIIIPIKSAIGNLYILKTKGKVLPYNGKYSDSLKPTIQT